MTGETHYVGRKRDYRSKPRTQGAKRDRKYSFHNVATEKKRATADDGRGRLSNNAVEENELLPVEKGKTYHTKMYKKERSLKKRDFWGENGGESVDWKGEILMRGTEGKMLDVVGKRAAVHERPVYRTGRGRRRVY